MVLAGVCVELVGLWVWQTGVLPKGGLIVIWGVGTYVVFAFAAFAVDGWATRQAEPQQRGFDVLSRPGQKRRGP
jgi:hypothetical protein